jgi:hypothetical protein
MGLPAIGASHHALVDTVARGKEDLRQTLTMAEYVDGGTVGPAPQAR